MNRILLPACLLTTPLFVGCHSAPDHSALIEETFIQSGLPLAVLGASTPDGTEQFESFSTDGQVGPDSVFEIASMTKAVTATAVMQLVEAGRIDLDAPVARYLPEIKQVGILNEDLSIRPGTRPITMRQLLSHTAGFGYFFNSPRIARAVGWDPEGMSWPEPERIPEGEYDWGWGQQPRRLFEAGDRWHYGRNIGVAGTVVERVSGMDLDRYCRKHIFTPLGMDRTGYNLPEHIMEDQVPLFARNPATGDLIPMPSMRTGPRERFYGGGGLLSTPHDYLRFLTCLARGGTLDGVRILTESSVDTFFFTNQLPEGRTIEHWEDDPMHRRPDQPQRSFFDDRDTFSLAWAIEANPDEPGNRPQGVGYWSGLFNTYYTIDRTRGVVVVAFMQLIPFNDAMAYELYRVHEDRVYDEL